MYLSGLRPGQLYRVAEVPARRSRAHARDVWLEVDGKVPWFGRATGLVFSEDRDEIR
jgi:hypothetical protein